MPFPKKTNVTRSQLASSASLRKEKDAIIKMHTQTIKNSPQTKERASVFASITIEAAMAFPLFLFAAVCMIYLLEIMAIQITIRNALYDTAKQIASEAYVVEIVTPSQVEQKIVQNIGEERMNSSIIVGGDQGLSCGGSYMVPGTKEVRLQVSYRVRLPIPVFGKLGKAQKETISWKGWNGYVKAYTGADGEETVYVTETGTVYHKSLSCTYLDLSIQRIPYGVVESMRNTQGAKYYACERCGKEVSHMVYLTLMGNRYHSSISCSGLKRTVYAVKKSEAVGKGACARCYK